MYVWGWYPGIYVAAGRTAPTARAVTGEMHTMSPASLGRMVEGMLEQFEAQPPSYIVDTRKRHFPWDRPPLELWPEALQREAAWRENGPGEVVAAEYDEYYESLLTEKVGQDEAERYAAMRPLREYVMEHYRVVPAQEMVRKVYPGIDAETAERVVAPMKVYARKRGGD